MLTKFRNVFFGTAANASTARAPQVDPAPLAGGASMCESLEGRRLLAVTAAIDAAGVVTVNGDFGANNITISHEIFYGDELIVRDPWIVARYPYASVTKVQVRGFGGNDTITVESSDHVAGSSFGNAPVTKPCLLTGGTGNDTIEGGDGDDTIYGNDGNDVIVEHDGNNYIYGGNDDDVLSGGRGNDVIHGDDGKDNIWDTWGPASGSAPDIDHLFGDAGDDYGINCADGDTNDYASGGSGQDGLAGWDVGDTFAAGAAPDPSGGPDDFEY